MHKYLLLLFILLASCNQTNKGDKTGFDRRPRNSIHELPIQITLDKYRELLDYNNDEGFIKIDTSSIKLIDKKEVLSPDDFELFRFDILNGAHYEYNNGRILCLALVSKYDSADTRILFPLSYAKSSMNFFDPYLNKSITSKNSYCTNLSNLINGNITYQTKDIEYKYRNGDNALTVISKYNVGDYDISNKKNTTHVETDSVLFTFNRDTLKSLVKLDKL